MKKRVLCALLILAIVFAMVPTTALADDPRYIMLKADTFNSSNVGTTINLTGTAVTSGGSIELVKDLGAQGGGAFLTRQIAQDTGFSTAFKVFLGPGTANTADGFVFIVAANSNAIGATGGSMGYAGIDNSIAIEYDTWNNGSIGASNNPDVVPHIGLGQNGVHHSDSAMTTGGTPATDLGNATLFDPYGDQQFAGKQNYTLYGWAEYDASTYTLEVRFSDTSTRPTDATASYSLPSFASSVGDYYHIGFTASTGGSQQQILINQWYVANEYIPEGLDLTSPGNYIQDNDAPTAPTISLSGDNTYVIGGSTDSGSGVWKYQYSTNGGATWTNYDPATDPDIILTNTSANTTVIARALDKVGNISATTTQVFCPITSSCGPEGTISPLGTVWVESGGSRKYEMTASAMKNITDVIVNGVSVPVTGGEHTITNVTVPTTIYPDFGDIRPGQDDTDAPPAPSGSPIPNAPTTISPGGNSGQGTTLPTDDNRGDRIVWSIVDDGGTGARLVDGKLVADRDGTVILQASGKDYTRRYPVMVTAGANATNPDTGAAAFPLFLIPGFGLAGYEIWRKMRGGK